MLDADRDRVQAGGLRRGPGRPHRPRRLPARRPPSSRRCWSTTATGCSPRPPRSWCTRCRRGPASSSSRGRSPTSSVVDATTAVFEELMTRQRVEGGGAGDHFAKLGANDRVWNALEKLAVTNPAVFVDYYANDVIAAIATAWLGPDYQVTSQVNVVNPGGKAQSGAPRLPPGLPARRDDRPRSPRTCTGCRRCSPCRARWRTATCRWRAARRCTCRTRRSTSPATSR